MPKIMTASRPLYHLIMRIFFAIGPMKEAGNMSLANAEAIHAAFSGAAELFLAQKKAWVIILPPRYTSTNNASVAPHHK
jgi:hypothetical protein